MQLCKSFNITNVLLFELKNSKCRLTTQMLYGYVYVLIHPIPTHIHKYLHVCKMCARFDMNVAYFL